MRMTQDNLTYQDAKMSDQMRVEGEFSYLEVSNKMASLEVETEAACIKSSSAGSIFPLVSHHPRQPTSPLLLDHHPP